VVAICIATGATKGPSTASQYSKLRPTSRTSRRKWHDDAAAADVSNTASLLI